MNDHDDDLPARVLAFRQARQWTQEQMAEAAGVSLRTYQNFETRQVRTQPNKLRAILRAAGLEEEDEQIAAATRSDWPDDIQVFLLAVGAYLDALPAKQREALIRDLIRQIFGRPLA